MVYMVTEASGNLSWDLRIDERKCFGPTSIKHGILDNGKTLFSVMKASLGLTVLMGNIGCYEQQITKGNQNIWTMSHGPQQHVWGCFSLNGVGLQKRIECSMDAKLYQAIIVNDIDVVDKCLVFPEMILYFNKTWHPHIELRALCWWTIFLTQTLISEI